MLSDCGIVFVEGGSGDVPSNSDLHSAQETRNQEMGVFISRYLRT